VLGAIGPVNDDRTELTELAAAHTIWGSKKVLRRLGALGDEGE
jgi:hypothetical protein